MHWHQFRYIIFLLLFIGVSIYVDSATAYNYVSDYERFNKAVPGSYASKLTDIETQRLQLQTELLEAKSSTVRKRLLKKAHNLFIKSVVDEIYPHWLGTKYDFHGTTQNPGTGKIACGYFVTTVLEDVGYPIERIRMAQAASERMILSMVDEAYVHRFRKVKIAKFVRAVENLGKGIYIVGLDTHAGMMYYDGVTLEFIHSTGFNPKEVIREPAITSRSLKKSKYKVIGKVTDDEDFIKRWILNPPIKF